MTEQDQILSDAERLLRRRPPGGKRGTQAWPLLMFLWLRRYCHTEVVTAHIYRWNARRKTKAEIGKRKRHKPRRDNFDLTPGTRLYWWRARING